MLRELRPGEWKLSLRTGANGRINATRACALLGGGGHAALGAEMALVDRKVVDARLQKGRRNPVSVGGCVGIDKAAGIRRHSSI